MPAWRTAGLAPVTRVCRIVHGAVSPTPKGGFAPFGRWFLNSALVAGSVTILQTFFSALAAYAFAKRRFPGRDLIFYLFLGTMMFPGAVLFIPNYIVLKDIPLFGGNNLLGAGGHGWRRPRTPSPSASRLEHHVRLAGV